jgi:hypothetical protein
VGFGAIERGAGVVNTVGSSAGARSGMAERGCGAAGCGGRPPRRRASYGAGDGQLTETDQQHSGPEEKTDRSMDRVGKLEQHADDSQGWSAAVTLKRRALMKRIGPVAQVIGTVL